MLQLDVHGKLAETTAPTEEPVSVADLRQQVSIDHTEDDLWLREMGKAARQLVEQHIERQLLTATYTLTLDAFPDVIELNRPPVQSITSLKYYDTDDTLTTLTENTDFVSDIISEPARLVPVVGTSWPATRIKPNAVTAVFVCGETTADNVSPRAKLAIKMLVSHWYDQRSAGSAVAVNEIALAYRMLLDSLRWRIGI